MTSSAGRICAKSAAVRGGFSGSLTRRLGIPSLLSRIRFPQADHARHSAAIRDDRDMEASRNRTHLYGPRFTVTGTVERDRRGEVHRGVLAEADPIVVRPVLRILDRVELDQH